MGDVGVGGGTEEMEKETGGEEKGGERVVSWERFLPRMVLRVLLVEADDSTRQIIAALLRKCSYRVAAVSDGLKAWETLKEKSQSIDLVLTEVELPSVSGYGLLTMIMEHEICKNIPVIMMSSHDSVNLVFKCMLKGAADFLVKPIRKNELRNLWQHVWRRHSSNGGPGGTCWHQVDNLSQLKNEANSENNAASNHSSDFIYSIQKNGECSKKGSDTQSSCTRPDTEAESAYMQNIQEKRQSNHINSPVVEYMRDHKDVMCDKLNDELPICEGEAEDRLALDVALCSQLIDSSECFLEKEDPNSGARAQKVEISAGYGEDVNIQYENTELKFGQRKPSREVDLIGAMDHQSQDNHGSKRYSAVRLDVSKDEILDDANDQKFTPLLGPLLKKSKHIMTNNQEKNEFNLLNHSHSSAFSRYTSKVVSSPLSPSNGFRRTELKDCSSNTNGPTRNQGLYKSNNSQSYIAILNMNLEDADSQNFCLPSGDGTGPGSHLGLIPFPVPIAGITYDGLRPNYSSAMKPLSYTEPGLPVWSLNPVNQEAACASLSDQSDGEILNSGQSNYPHSQDAERQSCEAEREQNQNMESLEKQHVSSVTGQSRSSSICNGSRSHPNSSGCGSVCNGNNGNLTLICNGSATGVSRNNVECANGNGVFTSDGIKPIDIHRSIQREAALNKFRLKRKDRCYEKKVRYQSRKKMAEQRPRVKGQFVRQVKLDA